MHRLIALALLAFASQCALAQQAAPLSADPVLEARVLHVAEELRCLVCQNETIAASNADLAVDLRAQIRTQLKAGRSEQQIRDFMVARYGEFILYRPALSARTLLLWGGPFLLLLIAAAAMYFSIRRHRRRMLPAALTPDEAQRARALLGEPAAEP